MCDCYACILQSKKKPISITIPMKLLDLAKDHAHNNHQTMSGLIRVSLIREICGDDPRHINDFNDS